MFLLFNTVFTYTALYTVDYIQYVKTKTRIQINIANSLPIDTFLVVCLAFENGPEDSMHLENFPHE